MALSQLPDKGSGAASPAASCPAATNTGIKIMSLQKTWGNVYPSALGAMLLSLLLVGCDNSVAQNAAPPAPAVSAADVVVKSISQWDSFNGRIEAVESVQLRPRVSGYIDKVNYADGQEVKKGEVLFTIDDRTYRAALEQAQANLARAKTQASLAQSEANRTDKLVNTNVVSREEWEQRRSAATQAQADIRAARRRLMPHSSTWISPKSPHLSTAAPAVR
jgi:multidrug efflux system membrane fusion protein